MEGFCACSAHKKGVGNGLGRDVLVLCLRETLMGSGVHLEEIYLFSTNPKKLGELRDVFSGVRVESLGLVVKPLPEVVEDGLTFEANAQKKALAGAVASGHATIADDSGLEVDALKGEPGVWSDRFAIRHGEIPPQSDRDVRTRANNLLLLEMLKDSPRELRGARFVCALSCAFPSSLLGSESGERLSELTRDNRGDWALVTLRGTCEGYISSTMDGSGGFGYDPLFWSVDLQKTFGGATAEEKRSVSHRGRAANKMRILLKQMGLL